jgi:hypothetical protein
MSDEYDRGERKILYVTTRIIGSNYYYLPATIMVQRSGRN